MPRRRTLWSVTGIRHPDYPMLTVRVVEPKPGAALVVYWWERRPGKKGRQRGAGLGVTRSMLGRTQREQQAMAEHRGRKFILGLATGGDSEDAPLTLDRLAREYGERKLLGVSQDYRRGALGCLARVRKALGPEYVIASLRPSDVEQYLASRASDGVIAGRRDMVALSIACNWAVGERMLGANPFANPNLKRLLYAKHKPSRPFCTPDEFAALLAVAPQVVRTVACKHTPGPAKNFRPDVRRRRSASQDSAAAFPTLLQLAWHTGHRISAILSLRWDAVDFTPRPDAPFGAITWYKGTIEETKKRYEHEVPMNELTRKALLAWREDSPVQSIARWVFPFLPKSERPLSYDEVRRWLREAIALANLPKKQFGGWHMFRRGFATARKGMPLRDLATAGGWRDTETLMRSYVHATTEGTLRVALYSA